MTIDEAVEIIEEAKEYLKPEATRDGVDALQLGTEALKRTKDYRARLPGDNERSAK